MWRKQHRVAIDMRLYGTKLICPDFLVLGLENLIQIFFQRFVQIVGLKKFWPQFWCNGAKKFGQKAIS